MTGPTHILIGVGATIGLAHATGIRPDAVQLLTVVIGSLAPDIDGNGSVTKLGTLFRVLLGWRIAKALDMYTQAISQVVSSIFGHRGFLHSPCIVLVIFSGAIWFNLEWLCWFAWGYAWHLIGDAVTLEGIPMLSPFSTRRRSIGRIRVGSATEGFIAAILVVVTCVAGWPLLPQAVKQTHIELWRAVSG